VTTRNAPEKARPADASRTPKVGPRSCTGSTCGVERVAGGLVVADNVSLQHPLFAPRVFAQGLTSTRFNVRRNRLIENW